MLHGGLAGSEPLLGLPAHVELMDPVPWGMICVLVGGSMTAVHRLARAAAVAA